MRPTAEVVPAVRFAWILGLLAVPMFQEKPALRVLDVEGLKPAERVEAQRERREAFLERAGDGLASGWRTQRDHETTVFHHGAGHLVEDANRYERKGRRFLLSTYWNWGMAEAVKRSPPSIRHHWSIGDAPPFEVQGAALWIVFFHDGPGARKKNWQGLLETYASNIAAAVREEEKRNPAPAVPADREQEATLLTAERKTWEALRGAVAKRAFEATFAGWTDEDFAAIDAAFVEFLIGD